MKFITRVFLILGAVLILLKKTMTQIKFYKLCIKLISFQQSASLRSS